MLLNGTLNLLSQKPLTQHDSLYYYMKNAWIIPAKEHATWHLTELWITDDGQ